MRAVASGVTGPVEKPVSTSCTAGRKTLHFGRRSPTRGEPTASSAKRASPCSKATLETRTATSQVPASASPGLSRSSLLVAAARAARGAPPDVGLAGDPAAPRRSPAWSWARVWHAGRSEREKQEGPLRAFHGADCTTARRQLVDRVRGAARCPASFQWNGPRSRAARSAELRVALRRRGAEDRRQRQERDPGLRGEPRSRDVGVRAVERRPPPARALGELGPEVVVDLRRRGRHARPRAPRRARPSPPGRRAGAPPVIAHARATGGGSGSANTSSTGSSAAARCAARRRACRTAAFCHT